MAQQAFDLNQWCNDCGLTLASDGHWRSRSLSSVSYPDNAHNAFSELEESSYWFNHRNTIITGIVTKHAPPGTIFDVGGGNGYVSLALRKAGFDSVVVEPGPHAVAVAKKRGLPVIEAAFQDLDVPAGSIPAIGMFDVLEHIEDDTGALRGLYNALAPGGMLYLAVPAIQQLWSGEDIAAGHYRRYHLKKLEAAVRKAGFEVKHGSYFFGVLTLPVAAFRAAPWRIGLRSKPSQESAARAHKPPTGLAGSLVMSRLKRERERAKTGAWPAMGSSCFVVARKPARPPE